MSAKRVGHRKQSQPPTPANHRTDQLSGIESCAPRFVSASDKLAASQRDNIHRVRGNMPQSMRLSRWGGYMASRATTRTDRVDTRGNAYTVNCYC